MQNLPSFYQLGSDFVKQLFRIQIQKGGKVLLWNQVKFRNFICNFESTFYSTQQYSPHKTRKKQERFYYNSTRKKFKSRGNLDSFSTFFLSSPIFGMYSFCQLNTASMPTFIGRNITAYRPTHDCFYTNLDHIMTAYMPTLGLIAWLLKCQLGTALSPTLPH